MKKNWYKKGNRVRKRTKPRSSDTYIPTSKISSGSSRRSSTSSGGLTGYTSSESRYTGNAVEKKVAQVAAAELGFIHLNVPGAAVGWVKSGELYDYMHTEKLSLKKFNGMYTGKFKNPKRFSRTPKFQCMTDGSLIVDEKYGSVTDPNSVMLLHSTYNVLSIATAMYTAFLRKLFKKAGICVSDRDGSLGLFSPFNADGFRIELQTMNQALGTVVTYAYTTVTADTLTTAVANSNFTQYWTNNLNNVAAANNVMPCKLFLYSSDRNGVDTNWRMASQLDLLGEYVEVYTYSLLTVQNQTKAATSDSNAIDRNDTQPLNGTIYNFSGEPRLKAIGNVANGSTQTELIKFQGAGAEGIRLLRAQDFVNTAFHEPPPTDLFANVGKKGHIGLQPGEMKKHFLKHVFKGKYINIMPKLRMEQFGGANPIKLNGVPCKSTLLFFQERMRTASIHPVVVAYEHNLTTGVKCSSSKPKIAMQTNFISGEYNL